MATTIDDVAKKAGVSIKTVSRVLNDSSKVSPKTAQKVREAMEILGYQPNVLARGLAKNTSDVIGVVIGHGGDLYLSNPYLIDVLNGVSTTALRNGYQVLLVQTLKEVPHAGLIAAKRVAGMVFMSVQVDDANVRALSSAGLPFVLTGRLDAETANFVDVDSVKGSFIATEHLIRLGHTRIGLILGPANHTSSIDRLRGYRQALEANAIAYRANLVVSGDFSATSGYGLTQTLLAQHPAPTAIFAISDLMATGAVRAIELNGLSVPGDVSVVGFDDISTAQYLNPPLTTVRQSGIEKGVLAAKMLLHLIRKQPLARNQVLLTPELVVRESTAPAKRQ